MTLSIVLFWIVVGVLGFALALAIQMRVLVSVALARAVRAEHPKLDIRPSRVSVWMAGNGDDPAEAEGDLGPAIATIYADYPKPLSHLRLARRACRILPLTLVIVVVGWQLVTRGGF